MPFAATGRGLGKGFFLLRLPMARKLGLAHRSIGLFTVNFGTLDQPQQSDDQQCMCESKREIIDQGTPRAFERAFEKPIFVDISVQC
jgi:hypothetical protein